MFEKYRMLVRENQIIGDIIAWDIGVAEPLESSAEGGSTVIPYKAALVNNEIPCKFN